MGPSSGPSKAGLTEKIFVLSTCLLSAALSFSRAEQFDCICRRNFVHLTAISLELYCFLWYSIWYNTFQILNGRVSHYLLLVRMSCSKNRIWHWEHPFRSRVTSLYPLWSSGKGQSGSFLGSGTPPGERDAGLDNLSISCPGNMISGGQTRLIRVQKFWERLGRVCSLPAQQHVELGLSVIILLSPGKEPPKLKPNRSKETWEIATGGSCLDLWIQLCPLAKANKTLDLF